MVCIGILMLLFGCFWLFCLLVFSTLPIIFFPFILSLRVLCLLICLFDCLSFERSQCRNLGGNWLTTVCLSCNCNSCYQANPTILLLMERFGPKKVTNRAHFSQTNLNQECVILKFFNKLANLMMRMTLNDGDTGLEYDHDQRPLHCILKLAEN